MRNPKIRPLKDQVEAELAEINESKGLPFKHLLDPDRILKALGVLGIEFRERVYTPVVTLWAFLSQLMERKDGSCESAVGRVMVDRLERGKPACSPDTSSYCKARQRFPEKVISKLVMEIGAELHDQADTQWKLKDRDVVIVDGSTSSMADTKANQKKYPQSSSQKAGLGFPILRFVALISYSSAAILGCKIAPCKGKKTGEQNLFRKMIHQIKDGTILLGDCLYDSYRDIVKLKARNVDVIFGKNQSRKADFRRGEKLGADDHIVTWSKPRYDKSRFGSRKTWESLPETMVMRETRLILKRTGYKTRVIIVVSTLLDATLYTKAELLNLFSQRWHCELDLRSIKCSVGMKELKCKTPSMVRKELWTYLLAYNLVRTRMAQAAKVHHKIPRQLSFQSALTFIRSFLPALERAQPENIELLERELLIAIAHRKVGNRPGRKEPRSMKKRTKKYSYLSKPRSEARKGLPA